MLIERGYERETNCSEMLRTSSRLLRAQRVHRACCICVHANELAAAWPNPPTLIQSTVKYHGILCIEMRRFKPCRSKMVRSRTVKLCEHV